MDVLSYVDGGDFRPIDVGALGNDSLESAGACGHCSKWEQRYASDIRAEGKNIAKLRAGLESGHRKIEGCRGLGGAGERPTDNVAAVVEIGC